MIDIDLEHRFPGGPTVRVKVRTDGPTLGLVGPSGVGKTTALRCIAGLMRPERGRVVIDDRVLLDTQAGVHPPVAQRQVAYVPQDALLFPHLNVASNLLYSPRSDPADLPALAEQLEITTLLHRRPRHLSGGERQRVALGRALLSKPQVLLCDEPFAALDEPRRDRLAAVLGGLRAERGLPLILVSHRLAEVHLLTESVLHLQPDAP